MSYDVTVIGEIYLDHIFSGFGSWPEPGEEIFTKDYDWELGGGAITTACALSLLGRKVQLIGIVGEAQFATVEARLAEFGVSAEHLVSSKGRTGVTVSISTRQDRTFFTYRGVNDELIASLTEDEGLLQRAAATRHVHLAMPLSAPQAAHILPVLRQQGAAISLDVGHHLEWLVDPASHEVIRSIDYLMPNEKEAAIIGETTQGYLHLCRHLGVRAALVKLGGEGAIMQVGDSVYRATAPAVSVVDTTGAGDAYDAGFIDGLLSGLTPRECLERGCVCGALSTRAAGALKALPTAIETALTYQETYAA